MPAAIHASTIAHQAFRFMELRPLTGFGEDMPETIAATEQYPVAIDMLLEAYDWSFARRVDTPARAEAHAVATDDPALPLTFQIADDVLLVRHVAGPARWRIDGRVLRTDAEPVQIRVTRRLRNESALPATFRTACAYQLAHLLAPEFVGSRTKQADIADNLQRSIQQAIRNDGFTASQARGDGLADEDWLTDICR